MARTKKVTLKDKINKKIPTDGARVLEAKETSPGQFELDIEIPAKKESFYDLMDRNKLSSLIRERKYTSGSLAEKLFLELERDNLSTKLEIAKMKDEIITGKEYATLNTSYRDTLENSYLDARKKTPEESKAKELYERSDREYIRTGIYGTTIDRYSNFAATGFFNEIDDIEIKDFYDAWVFDTSFVSTVHSVFHQLFKQNVCYLMLLWGDYEPHSDGISSIPGKKLGNTKSQKKAKTAKALHELIKKTTGEKAELDKEAFNEMYEEAASLSKTPIGFSILNPKDIIIQSVGVMGACTIKLSQKGAQRYKKLYKDDKDKKLSAGSSAALKLFPNNFKKAVIAGEEYTFQDEEINVLFLQKNDYDDYAVPKGARAFDSFDYKEELKKADYATVDGIYNSILKVTVGDKDNPVTDTNVLADLAEAFNTPQKAFTIVWGHTLSIEKITAPEVGAILGEEKYKPVNADIDAALGVARALIDGSNISGDAAVLISNSVQSDIDAARFSVENWIYKLYKTIAVNAKFDAFPKVRWKTTVISTETPSVTRASWMQMLDRKATSTQTYMREQNFDFDSEISRMEEEWPLVLRGILKAGSPFQPVAPSLPPAAERPATPAVPKPSGPSGDSGRPPGQVNITKQKPNPINTVKTKTKVVTKAEEDLEVDQSINELIESFSLNDPDFKSKLLASLNNLKEIE